MKTAVFVGLKFLSQKVAEAAAGRFIVVSAADAKTAPSQIVSTAASAVVLNAALDQPERGAFAQRLRNETPEYRGPVVVFDVLSMNQPVAVFELNKEKRVYEPRVVERSDSTIPVVKFIEQLLDELLVSAPAAPAPILQAEQLPADAPTVDMTKKTAPKTTPPPAAEPRVEPLRALPKDARDIGLYHHLDRAGMQFHVQTEVTFRGTLSIHTTVLNQGEILDAYVEKTGLTASDVAEAYELAERLHGLALSNISQGKYN